MLCCAAGARCAVPTRQRWLHGRKESWELRADFLALHPGSAPRKLDASQVLEGLTPDDVCEAVEGVGFGQTHDERNEAVARVVRRRQSLSLREEREAYPAHLAGPGNGEASDLS